jgi:hypothetical protein
MTSMKKAIETDLARPAAESQVPASRLKLAPLSLIAPPISWAIIFIARRISDAPLNGPAANVMISLLWIGGAVTLAGFVLAILALRPREGESRPLSILSLVLNFINLVFYLSIGLLAIFLSV